MGWGSEINPCGELGALARRVRVKAGGGPFFNTVWVDFVQISLDVTRLFIHNVPFTESLTFLLFQSHQGQAQCAFLYIIMSSKTYLTTLKVAAMHIV